MLSQRQTQLTRIELETLLDERFNAFGQQLLKQILDEVVTDNTQVDRIVAALDQAVTSRDLIMERLGQMQTQLDALGHAPASAPVQTSGNPHPASNRRH